MDITRQVESLWATVEATMRAQEVEADQITEMKKAFYLGVEATLRYQRDAMGPLAVTTPQGVIEHLNAMYAEAHEFLYPTQQQ
jgi:hypothetical protein